MTSKDSSLAKAYRNFFISSQASISTFGVLASGFGVSISDIGVSISVIGVSISVFGV